LTERDFVAVDFGVQTVERVVAEFVEPAVDFGVQTVEQAVALTAQIAVEARTVVERRVALKSN
jgi:hypothetical protein